MRKLRGSKVLQILFNLCLFCVSALSAVENAYVSNFTDGTVSVIDTTNNMVTATITVGTNPTNLVVSPDGTKVYVANNGSNDVSVIDTANNMVTATISVGNTPQGIAITPDGTKVYVTNSGNGNVY